MACVLNYYLSSAEYLALERKAEFKSEYLDGLVDEMAGGSERHSLIVANILDVILNPTLMVEVSSESTPASDRGKRSLTYQQVSSSENYLLVSEDEILVEGYASLGSERWLYTKVTGLEGVLGLQSVECNLALKDVYDQAT